MALHSFEPKFVLSAPIKILIHEKNYDTSKFTKTENFLLPNTF